MPSTTNIQKAAFDAIDTLHFSQVFMSLIYGRPIAKWYHDILTRIYEILDKEGISGKQAEITKHYLLGALEIYLSIDQQFFSARDKYDEEPDADGMLYTPEIYKLVDKKSKKLSLIMLHIIASYNGVAEEFIFQATMELLNDKALALSTAPTIVRNRLVECCYAFEYPDAPLGFYHELVNRDIISCGKYSHKNDKYKQEVGSELSSLFIRACLLLEFKMLQRAMNVKVFSNNTELCHRDYDSRISPTDRKMIIDYYKRMIEDEGQNGGLFSTANFFCKEHTSEIRARTFLKQMNKFYFHKRMFGGTQGSWLGTLGAFYIELWSSEEPKKAIYYEADNSQAISEEIKLKFSNCGFNVSARSLYLRHKATKNDDYAKIRYYYNLVLNQPFMVPWYLNNKDYYELALKYKGKDANK
ncbi:hypothetical protein A3Q29_11055 [Providencia stuartii]|uniref:Uncharacterized protein n=1 Tax=Providencia stuartii TaxID=588 RepID=A0A1S1HPR6_PROST|nr:hypothetical protein A3Q29_11055 [Providencia stuartii]